MKKILIGLILSMSSLAQAAQYLYCDARGASEDGKFKLKQVVFAVTEIEAGSTAEALKKNEITQDAYFSVLPIYEMDGQATSDRFSTYHEDIKDALKLIQGKKTIELDVQGTDLHTNGYFITTKLNKERPTFKIYKKSGDESGKKELVVKGQLSCKKKNLLGVAKCILNDPTHAYDKFYLSAFEYEYSWALPLARRKARRDRKKMTPEQLLQRPIDVKAMILSRDDKIVTTFSGKTTAQKLEAFAAGVAQSIDGKREFAMAQMTSDEKSPFFIPEDVKLNFEAPISKNANSVDVRPVTISWGEGKSVNASCIISDLTKGGK